jgi:hypothetical protein
MVSPFILCLLAVTFAYNTIKIFVLFLMHGGEWINYSSEDTKTINNLYQELKKQKQAPITEISNDDNVFNTFSLLIDFSNSGVSRKKYAETQSCYTVIDNIKSKQ